MKVILCTPIEGYSEKTPMIPLGITFIAGTLEKEGYEVKIIDNYLEKPNYELFLKHVKKYNPDIVGVTCNVEDRFGAFKLSKNIKEKYPHIKVVLGGPFPSACHKQILEDISSVDIVVRGEGELTFLDILEHMKKDENLDDVEGITYRDGEIIKINKIRPFIKNLDDLPWPAFHLLRIKDYPNYFKSISKLYKVHVKYTTSLIFGRGCPFDCLFCSSKELWRKTYRIIRPENAVAQINYFVEMGIEGFAFWDDHLLLNKKWFIKFADEIKKENLDIQFKCLTRVDSIDREVTRILYDIGCRVVSMGIENGSPRILKLMNKSTTPYQVERAVELLSKNGIGIQGLGSIVNIPGETLNDITLNLKFFKKLDKKYSQHSYAPSPMIIYPGTDLERIAMKNGHLDNFRWTQNYFEKRNLLAGSSPYTPLYENIPTEDLMKYIIKELFRLEYYGPLRSIVELCLLNPHIDNYNLSDRLNTTQLLSSWIFDCVKEAPWKKKVSYVFNLIDETLGYKIKKSLLYKV